MEERRRRRRQNGRRPGRGCVRLRVTGGDRPGHLLDGQVARGDRSRAREEHRAFDDVAELANVPRPAVLEEHRERLLRELRRATAIAARLREKNVRHSGINRNGQTIEVRFRDAQTLAVAKEILLDQFTDLQSVDGPDGSDYKLTASIKPAAARRVQDQSLKQNITTLHNRINELGVAEPVIQQQGLDRIVVQLPGVQDTAKAKDILGRTATLEVRMVDESGEARAVASSSQQQTS